LDICHQSDDGLIDILESVFANVKWTTFVLEGDFNANDLAWWALQLRRGDDTTINAWMARVQYDDPLQGALAHLESGAHLVSEGVFDDILTAIGIDPGTFHQQKVAALS
jgi:hypothetical protein